MSFRSEFQTFGATTQNARLAVSVRVYGTKSCRASVDRRDYVVTWRCRSSSMYGGTEVDRALCMVTAILYWICCWTGSQWRDYNSGLAYTCAADRRHGQRCFELSAAYRRLQQEHHRAYSSKLLLLIHDKMMLQAMFCAISVVWCLRTCRRACNMGSC